MALTPEQQAQIDFQIEQQKIAEAAEASRRQHEKEMENLRHQNNLAVAAAQAAAQVSIVEKQTKLESVRLAKETLIENRRIKPASSAADITGSDIIAFAITLETHVNS
jgi:hypothetical protein